MLHNSTRKRSAIRQANRGSRRRRAPAQKIAELPTGFQPPHALRLRALWRLEQSPELVVNRGDIVNIVAGGTRMKTGAAPTCVLIEPNTQYHGKQGLDYFSGVAAET